jgi:tRNA ligase
MAIVVRVIDDDWESSNSVPHITIGTRGNDVKPKESNDLLAKWLQVGSGDLTGIGEAVIPGSTVVEGTVHGVLSR